MTMKTTNGMKWGAATGFLSVAVGMAAVAFERGAPGANAGSEEAIAYIRQYQGELLAQSLVFIIGACVSLCFFSSLRSYLRRAEGGAGSLSGLAFGAGCVYAGLQLTLQGFQIAMAMTVGAEPSGAAVLSALGWAMSVVAYAPLALMLASVAALSLRRKAFPVWLGILSAVAAAANLLMLCGILVKDGPLAPGGALTYAAYALLPIWLVATAAMMIRGIGKQGANS